ncbi:MAG: 50S ribosomal protein L20 [Opitutales bacterium]|nr:50S ribosomal protein L20 [Opitutales bacterium]
MPRVTNIVSTHARRKRVLKSTRGYFGNKSRLYKFAKDAQMHAGVYAYRDRRARRREFRSLWIARINAACRSRGLKYSVFMAALKKANIALDRKQLSELAIQNAAGFDALVKQLNLA